MADQLSNSVALPQHSKAAARLAKAQTFKAKVMLPQKTKPLWQHYAVATVLFLAAVAYIAITGEAKAKGAGSYLTLAIAAVVFWVVFSRATAHLHYSVLISGYRTDVREGFVRVFPSKLRTEIEAQLKGLEVNLTFQQFVRRHPEESVKMIDAFTEWEREPGADSPQHSPESAQHLWAFIRRTTQELAKADKQSLAARAEERAARLKERFPLPPGDDTLASADVPNDASSITLNKE